jgi:hypothetical protein
MRKITKNFIEPQNAVRQMRRSIFLSLQTVINHDSLYRSLKFLLHLKGINIAYNLKIHLQHFMNIFIAKNVEETLFVKMFAQKIHKFLIGFLLITQSNLHQMI